MAGNGGIGGGSCTVKFEITDGQGAVISSSVGKDNSFHGKVKVTFNFPNEPPKVVELGPHDQITYSFDKA